MSRKRPLHRRFGRAFVAAWREMSGAEHRAAFDGAGVNRLLLDWIMQARSADEEIRGDIKLLRARGRELGRNNSYATRYFRLLANNVVGPTGMTVRGDVWRGDQLDDDVNNAIEAAWRDWASSPVTVDGKLTLRRLEKLLLKTMACDGEAFVRVWRGYQGNRLGFALQPIDADLVDETYNRPRQGTLNEIRMGIEVDALARVVGYHVWDRTGTSGLAGQRTRYFVPAAEMIHLYDPDRVNQTRGITWLHSIMVPAHMLNAYEESEAVAARIGASQMGFWERKEDSGAADLSLTKTRATMKANPGTFPIGPSGYEFKGWNPEHPTAQFGLFVKQMLRKIASGVSVFYNVLANDAEHVTYSTMRSFLLVERDDWRAIAQDFIDMWRRPLYDLWLSMALTTGRLALPLEDRARYQVMHRSRGWQWIDPERETKADVLAIRNGLATCTDRLAARGLDIEDVFAERARELKLAAKHGINIDGPVPSLSEKWGDGDDESESDDEAKGNGKKADRSAPANRLGAVLSR